MKDKRSSSKSSKVRKAFRRRTSFHKADHFNSAILQEDQRRCQPGQSSGSRTCTRGPSPTTRGLFFVAELSNPRATQAPLNAMSDSLLSPVESAWIRERARALGFDDCGVAPAEKFPELDNFSEWLERGYGGEMKYLEDPRRRDPRRPMPGARSLIVCALNYNGEQPYSTECKTDVDDSTSPQGWISRYAWGDDYHEVLWEKLNKLAAEMRAHFPE